jgi:hypothetical protein
VRVKRVPVATELEGEIVNSVVVGKGVAATASTALENATASARPRKTGGEFRSLFKETSEEAFTIPEKFVAFYKKLLLSKTTR